MSIQRRVNAKGKVSWRVRVYSSETRRSETVGTFERQRDAVTAEATFRTAAPVLLRSTVTIAEWRAMWLETSTVRDSTRAWHADRTKLFVDRFGARPLLSWSRVESLAWAKAMPSTVHAISAMWTAAVNAELVDANEHPWRGLVTRGRRRLEPGWLTTKDVDALADAARTVYPGAYGLVASALIYVGAYCGLRPGELAGLRWRDLAPDESRLSVRQQAESVTRTFTPPKNGQHRTVVYPGLVQDRIAAMPRLHDNLLFVGPAGAILFAASRAWMWRPIRQAAGRPSMAMHELRHFAASYLMERGLSSSDVAIQLGHTDGGALVEKTYSHHRPDPALARVEAILNAADTDTDEAQEAAS